MKKLISVVLAFAMCLSLFAGVGLIASADDAIDRYINVTGGTIVFENDAEHPWAYDSISIGKYGASSGNAGVDSSSSTVSTTLTFAEGEGICFTWKVSGQQKWDYLAFSIDGEEIARISGSFGPETRTFAVPAGEHPKRKKLKHVRFVTRTESRVAVKLRTGEKVLNSELRRDLAAISQALAQNQEEVKEFWEKPM